MLTIILTGLEFEGRHGASAPERRSTRKFVVNLEMDCEVTQAESSGFSTYNGGFVAATKRLSKGLQVDASYTFSKDRKSVV